jgi:Uma2 family endonuclease
MTQQTVKPTGQTPEQPSSVTAAPAVPPPLENGDRLTRAEFERRYDAMPQLKKAELIEGVVYVGSPVRYTQHGQPSSDIEIWLGTYRVSTPGVNSAGNTTVRLDLDNEPQPDTLLRIEHGGQSWIDEDGYLQGAPELVVEVAASSASYDLHDKLRAYRRNGVREYVIWRVLDGELDWLILRDGAYQQIPPDASGVVRSEAFPGLRLAVPALLAGDMASVLATLQEGLASAEHAAFVERLRARQSAPERAPHARQDSDEA